MVLVCLAVTAECHRAFEAADEWVVQLVHGDHTDIALRFATRGADKFGGGEHRAGLAGVPVLDDALATQHCTLHRRHRTGDHTVLVGEVVDSVVDRSRTPAIYFRRGFHRLP